MTIVTFVHLPAIINPPDSSANGLVLSASVTRPTPPNGKSITICVQGRQYIWRYTYGNGCLNGAFSGEAPYSYQTMYAPANTTVILDIQSTDVIHSWWIPSLGGKVDAVPGLHDLHLVQGAQRQHAGQPVIFHGQCAQLCGRSHAAMTALVKILSPADYKAWLSRQTDLINQANDQVTQLRQILTASGNLGG